MVKKKERRRRPPIRSKTEAAESLGYLFKIVLIGDGAVGKTALRERFLGKGFNAEYLMTVGADFAKHTMTLTDGTLITFQIWDIAGQPRFGAVRDIYYRGAQGGLVVFDITRRDSFENIGKWIEELWMHSGYGAVPYVLIGNKTDLRASVPGAIETYEGTELTEILSRETEPFDFQVEYIETSALTGENVERAFLILAEIFWLWLKKKDKI